MTPFIDRADEMSVLTAQYEQKDPAFVVVYGRRRVGKTELITEFCKGKPSLYFLVTEEGIEENKDAFRRAVAEYTGNTLLSEGRQFDWGTLFDALLFSVKDERLVIVLDEFQYLGRADSAFPSILQKIWDTNLRKKNVMLILCGSLISMMEEQTLSYHSPLYGRRTAQIRLQQIPFAHYYKFFEQADIPSRELLDHYAVTGGVPKYIELFQPYGDIYEAIERNILRRSSFLYEEPRFLLQNEVKEVGTYFSIIKTIAAGNRRLGQIAAVIETKATSLTKPLKTLMDLDIIEREVPATEEKPDSCKQGQYRIKDNFLSFWFQFIYPYQSFIESGHPEPVLLRIRRDLVPRHVAYVYEDVCRQTVWDTSARGELPELYTHVGRWWGRRDMEIDIVAIDAVGKQAILFGECKYRKTEPVGIEVFEYLKQKAAYVQWGGKNRKETYALFSVSGFTPELTAVAAQRSDLLLRTGLPKE